MGFYLSKLDTSFVSNNRKVNQKSLKLLSWAVFAFIRQAVGGGQPRAGTAAPGSRQVPCVVQSIILRTQLRASCLQDCFQAGRRGHAKSCLLERLYFLFGKGNASIWLPHTSLWSEQGHSWLEGDEEDRVFSSLSLCVRER